MVGTISILAGIASTLRASMVLEEVVAQGLLLMVLLGAVHRGKRGGLATAILAILIYVCMRIPLIMHEGFTPDVIMLLAARTLTYAIMGIGGGILCSRIHHFLARFESVSTIDAQTQLFNECFATTTLRSMIRQYERFHKPFSIVVLSSPAMPRPDKTSDNFASLRAGAGFLKDNVRLIDDVARLDDGRIVLIFPQTGKAGARIAADRIHRGLVQVLRVKGDVVRMEFLGADEDLQAIKELSGEPISGEIAQSGEACA